MVPERALASGQHRSEQSGNVRAVTWAELPALCFPWQTAAGKWPAQEWELCWVHSGIALSPEAGDVSASAQALCSKYSALGHQTTQNINVSKQAGLFMLLCKKHGLLENPHGQV